ncbi:enoyl-CoA hydratase/carnithine racemase [Variovorax sp. TBS-050B]|nr:enoyl-CoA hydratase/carnithine racemase [Variovorax sp. TBS-050B]
MAESLVQVEREGTVATVTLNRPSKLNSLTPQMLDQLELAARELEAQSDLRVVILTGGEEKAFCVGADINEWAALRPLDMWRRWVRRGHQVFDQCGAAASTRHHRDQRTCFRRWPRVGNRR